MAEEPWCALCLQQGRYRLGQVTDHKTALTNGGTDIRDNKQRLCVECHQEKTRRDLGQRERRSIGSDGWPE